MNVHTHHVAQSVRQEHGVGTSLDGLFHITLHQSHFLQAACHHAAHFHVDVIPQDAGLGHIQYVVVTGLHDAVDFQLALGELAAYWEGAGVVRAVELLVLRTGITKCQTAFLQTVERRIAVHDLAVLGENSRKTLMHAQRMSHAVHLTADIFLRHPRARQPHGRGMHLIAHGTGLLNLRNLQIRLHLPHVYDSHDQLHRSRFLLLSGMNAQQVEQLDLRVVAVGRQEMNLPLLPERLVADYLQLLHRSRQLHAHLVGHIPDGVHRTEPHDILYIDVVAHQRLRTVVDVNHTHQSVALLSEIVQERRVLPEGIVRIARIVTGSLIVAEEQYDAALHALPQFLTALYIDFFFEHICLF